MTTWDSLLEDLTEALGELDIVVTDDHRELIDRDRAVSAISRRLRDEVWVRHRGEPLTQPVTRPEVHVSMGPVTPTTYAAVLDVIGRNRHRWNA